MQAGYGANWSKLKAVADKWRAVLKTDLVAFNEVLSKHSLPQIQASGPALMDTEPPNRKFLPKPPPPAAKKKAGVT